MNLTTHKLSEQIDRKFVEQFEVSDWEVETDTGWEDVTFSNKTVEYQVFHIKLKNGMELKCADNHILFDENFNEIFAKNTLGGFIQTKSGAIEVISVEDLGYLENMYDLTVNSNDHRFYTNDILSHNTQTSAAYILWYTLFQEVKTVAILANKATAAREVMSRYQNMYEHLPIWLQQGIKTWNKGDIELENGSKIFTQATTPSGIRGKSCVTGDTKVCVEENEDIFYIDIKSLLNKSRLTNIENMKKIWILYKTTNTVNGKIYIDVHGTNNLDDGYLGSGKLLKQAVKEYGPDKFKREVLHQTDNSEEVELLEAMYVETRFRTKNMKIYSQGEFHNFKGFIEQGIPDDVLLFKFSDATEIKVTPEHRFLIGKSWIEARFLDCGDSINGKEVFSVESVEPEMVYDALEVETVHSYFTNGVESHNCNLLYVDEAAFIPTNIAEQFFTSVYPTISAGTTTKILLSSTPKGYNHFWKFWNEAEQGINDFKTLFIPYWEIPGRDDKWALEQRKLLGELKYNQEVLCLGPDSKITLRDKLTGKIFQIKIGEFYQFL